jgi:hypothetical protein
MNHGLDWEHFVDALKVVLERRAGQDMYVPNLEDARTINRRRIWEAKPPARTRGYSYPKRKLCHDAYLCYKAVPPSVSHPWLVRLLFSVPFNIALPTVANVRSCSLHVLPAKQEFFLHPFVLDWCTTSSRAHRSLRGNDCSHDDVLDWQFFEMEAIRYTVKPPPKSEHPSVVALHLGLLQSAEVRGLDHLYKFGDSVSCGEMSQLLQVANPPALVNLVSVDVLKLFGVSTNVSSAPTIYTERLIRRILASLFIAFRSVVLVAQTWGIQKVSLSCGDWTDDRGIYRDNASLLIVLQYCAACMAGLHTLHYANAHYVAECEEGIALTEFAVARNWSVETIIQEILSQKWGPTSAVQTARLHWEQPPYRAAETYAQPQMDLPTQTPRSVICATSRVTTVLTAEDSRHAIHMNPKFTLFADACSVETHSQPLTQAEKDPYSTLQRYRHSTSLSNVPDNYHHSQEDANGRDIRSASAASYPERDVAPNSSSRQSGRTKTATHPLVPKLALSATGNGTAEKQKEKEKDRKKPPKRMGSRPSLGSDLLPRSISQLTNASTLGESEYNQRTMNTMIRATAPLKHWTRPQSALQQSLNKEPQVASILRPATSRNATGPSSGTGSLYSSRTKLEREIRYQRRPATARPSTDRLRSAKSISFSDIHPL